MIEISGILNSLAEKRPIFHSEADFQHAFAWEVHHKLPNVSVRLERPVSAENQTYYIDVWIENNDEIIAVELKYKTRRLSVNIGKAQEQFNLKNQSAQDLGRYDFIKDIQRLERVAKDEKKFTGYAVLLTNDCSYWDYWEKPANENTADAAFRINDEITLSGRFKWGVNASAGTTKNREKEIKLENIYPVTWLDYSSPSQEKYGLFRYLAIQVLFK